MKGRVPAALVLTTSLGAPIAASGDAGLSANLIEEAEAASTLAVRGLAGKFLNCEGLGDGHEFWPAFREAYKRGGPLGSETLTLAYEKWVEWEAVVEEMVSDGSLSGGASIVLPGMQYSNGTVMETTLWDRLDLVKAFQRASFQALFGNSPSWGPEYLAGFLACPVGFVMTHYVIFLVHKARSKMSHHERVLNWESMSNAFGHILGLPPYALDFLESADWGVTSFDMAVNLNTEEGGVYNSYDDYCKAHTLPTPILRPWREDAIALFTAAATTQPDAIEAAQSALCTPVDGDAVRIALVGEHGAVNMDHFSTTQAALLQTCGSSTKIDAAHFFTYVWSLAGTSEGSALQAGLRMTWEAFWGSPLTASQGRKNAEDKSSGSSPSASSTSGRAEQGTCASGSADPLEGCLADAGGDDDEESSIRWTVPQAVQALSYYFQSEPFVRRSQVIVCCEPLWLCILLHAALGPEKLLVRASMCLLHSFINVFGKHALDDFWPLVRAFTADAAPLGIASAAARISAEMLAFQTGMRLPYVPALSLHVKQTAVYTATLNEVLIFRSHLPSGPSFRRLVKLMAADLNQAPAIVDMKAGISFADIASYRAVIILPHVPYAQRLSDVFAMALPSLVPAEPLIHKFVWPYAGPFCGRSDSAFSRSIDQLAENRSQPPYSPFDFQTEDLHPESFHNDRRYWLQYSEWELRPHLIRFRSVPHLLVLAATGDDELQEVSRRMRQHHHEVSLEAMEYWSRAALIAASLAARSEFQTR